MTFVLVLLAVLAILVLSVAAFVASKVFETRRIAARAERLVPRTGRTVEIDGNSVHYVEQGGGERAILFIHGLGAQLHQFRHPLFPLLKDFRLVAIDRPGSGYSTRPYAASASLGEQARVIAKFIDAFGLEKPLVVGHSLGGAVSLALALDHPDKIAGLALISPLTQHRDGVPPGMEPLDIRSDLKRWLLAQTMSVPMALKYAEPTLNFLFSPQPVPADYMTEGGGWLGLRPSHIYATGADFVAAMDDTKALAARYGELDMPVGILFGTGDKVLEYDRHGLIMRDQVKGLDLEIIEGLGHMPQFSHGDQVAGFVRRIAARAFGQASQAN